MTQTQQEHWDYTLNEWQNKEYFKTIISVLKERKIKNFIDIGANVGGVSHILIDNIPSIETAYLFEPQKDNFNYLVNKFKDSDKTICLNCGIYYGKKYLNMFKFKDAPHTGAYTVANDERIRTTFEQSDEIFCLNELEFFNFKPIDFVKMDIEGSEYNIIENSKFLQTVNLIEIELHAPVFSFEYIQKHFPNHQIAYYSAWDGKHIDHILLNKVN